MRPDITLNVTSLTQRLLAQKTTRDRFKFPCTLQQAFDLLKAAYMAEVAFRRGTFVDDERTSGHIALLADFLTSYTCFRVRGTNSARRTQDGLACHMCGKCYYTS